MTRRRLIRDVTTWMLVSTAVRLPVAMAPLLFLYLADARFGDYAAGTWIVGAFVVGELGGALLVGFRHRNEFVRTRLCIGLACSAAAFASLVAYEHLSAAGIGALAFAAGAGSASTPGVMQAMLLSGVPERSVPKVLSAVRVQSAVVFMAAPPLVAVMAAGDGARSALVVVIVATMFGAAGIWLLRAAVDRASSAGAASSRGDGLRAALRAWPIYLGGLAATFVVGVGDLLVVPLLVQRGHSAAWAGPILAGLFLAGVLGAVAYAVRSDWRVTLRTQTLTMTTMMLAGLVAAALSSEVFGIALGMWLAGIGVSVLLMIRTLALRAAVPVHLHPSAFSMNYSVSCISYLLCAVVAGTGLGATSASTTLLICVAAVLVASVVAAATAPAPPRASLATP